MCRREEFCSNRRGAKGEEIGGAPTVPQILPAWAFSQAHLHPVLQGVNPSTQDLSSFAERPLGHRLAPQGRVLLCPGSCPMGTYRRPPPHIYRVPFGVAEGLASLVLPQGSSGKLHGSTLGKGAGPSPSALSSPHSRGLREGHGYKKGPFPYFCGCS